MHLLLDTQINFRDFDMRWICPFFDNLSWNSCILQALIAMQLMTNFCFASGFLLKSMIIKLSSAGIQNRNLCRF